jgi:hypothetical protein
LTLAEAKCKKHIVSLQASFEPLVGKQSWFSSLQATVESQLGEQSWFSSLQAGFEPPLGEQGWFSSLRGVQVKSVATVSRNVAWCITCSMTGGANKTPAYCTVSFGAVWTIWRSCTRTV